MRMVGSGRGYGAVPQGIAPPRESGQSDPPGKHTHCADAAAAAARVRSRAAAAQRNTLPSLSITCTVPRLSARIGCSILARSPTTTQV